MSRSRTVASRPKSSVYVSPLYFVPVYHSGVSSASNMDAPVLPLAARDRRTSKGRDGSSGGAGDSCLYGSVVGLDKALALDAAAHAHRSPSPSSSFLDQEERGTVHSAASVCDECEERRARFECGDCGLAYCAPCDAHRHRKGKLVFHQRARINSAAFSSPAFDTSVSSPASSSASISSPQVANRATTREEDAVPEWGTAQVADWLRANDLEVFVEDAQTLNLDGTVLLSSARVDAFIEAATCAASRGHKKKLQREAQKLREAEQGTPAAAPVPPFIAPSTSAEPAGRMGLNLRVDVSPRATTVGGSTAVGAGGAETASFSPVAALRSRLAHGQTGDDARGRVLRRRSAFPGSTTGNDASLSSPRVSRGSGSDRPVMAEKRSRSLFLGASALKIDVDTPLTPTSAATATSTERAVDSGSSSVTKRQLVGVGALDLDMVQVKREENALGASFDFSATGRLQTQGFEINVGFTSRYHVFPC